MMRFDVLIVGAGHAGSQCAIALRQLKFEGTIGVVGEEPDLPYERPPLSKEYLQQQKTFERILVRPAAFWKEQQVTMLLARRVAQVLASEHAVVTTSGERLAYGRLVWAAGGEPRRLSCEGADLGGIHYIRRRADVEVLHAELPGARRVVVIGGGFTGLEAAASLRKMGKEVVVLEAADRVLARGACETLSRFVESEHLRHGVEVRLSSRIERIEGHAGRVTAVRLTDDTRLYADLVIAGIGITPSIEPLLQAGAEGRNGVAVDAHCHTSLPDVYAIGDCAAFANRHTRGAEVRIESVQNAMDQASAAARSILGEAASYDALPWFWSNQYELRLQTAGLSAGYDHTELRGDITAGSFAIDYFQDGRLIAVDCVNAPRDYVAARKALTAPIARVAQPDAVQPA
jgi:3-phenylpropionate/trans-cinnamate dioxygenase ferredoxin reductase subunit